MALSDIFDFNRIGRAAAGGIAGGLPGLLAAGATNQLGHAQDILSGEIDPIRGGVEGITGLAAFGVNPLTGGQDGRREDAQSEQERRQREAFERLARLDMQDAARAGQELGSRTGASLAARGLGDSPLSAGLVARNQAALQQGALRRIAERRALSESGILNLRAQEALLSRQQNIELLGIAGEIAGDAELMEELKGLGVNIMEVFGLSGGETGVEQGGVIGNPFAGSFGESLA